MLHIKFRGSQPPVLEKKSFERFLPYMVVNKLSFPLPMETPHKISTIGQAVSEKIFENVDVRRRTDDGSWL